MDVIISNDLFIFKIMCLLWAMDFRGLTARLYMPSNTFWTFTVGVSEPVRAFHPRECLTLLSITRHKFSPFYSTVQLCWTSSNDTKPTQSITKHNVDFSTMHSHPFNVMSPCTCNVMLHCRLYHGTCIMNATYTT